MLDSAVVEVPGQDDPVPVAFRWDGANALFPLEPVPRRAQDYYDRYSSGRIRLDYPRKVAGTLVVRAVLEPDDTATVLPDSPFLIYADAIYAWSLKEMCVMPGEAWSRPSNESRHAADYRAWTADAAVRTAQQGTTTPVRTATREFV